VIGFKQQSSGGFRNPIPKERDYSKALHFWGMVFGVEAKNTKRKIVEK
jgi:hypothetical protein